MIKRLILGDMHGLINIYEAIYHIENSDEVICLGDYVDSFNVPIEEQEDAMHRLMKMKEEHKNDKFTILLGNHDFQYLYGAPQIERYSGFSMFTYQWANKYFNELVDAGKIQIVYVDHVNNIVYSHAGISNTWFNDWKFSSLDDINSIFTEKVGGNLEPLRFNFGEHYNAYGDTTWNGCLWIRPKSLSSDMYKDEKEWRQIVGHTPGYTIRKMNNNNLIIADAIGKSTSEYLVQYLDENNNIIIEEIKSYVHEK